MSDLVKEYTVSEIVKGIKDTLEGKYFYIKIKGEISNFKKHPSGHFYFSLKDEDSMINVVMFKWFADYCKIDLSDGMEIVVAGKLTIYKERSNYQLVAEAIQVSGIGTLLKIIQERKEKLAKEGIFDAERKKPIPRYPRNAAIITAESGAAIHDILSRLKNRTPIKLILYSVLMQGKGAPDEIIEAIKFFNALKDIDKPKVIVITRGGGSVEDLMAFNDEDLVRAVANSKIPIISAVGHEIDWTLIDYASDLRLPTPTSVAEYLTISKEQAYKNLENLVIKLYSVLVFRNRIKLDRLSNIFNDFLIKKFNRFIKKDYFLQSILVRFSNIFRIIIEKYKRKIYFVKSVNINKIIKVKLSKLSEKIKIFDLKLENYASRYPILKDTLGSRVRFKKDLVLNKNYILEFPDGNVKIKIIKV